MSAVRLILALLLPIIGGCASHAPVPVEERGTAPATVKPSAQAVAAATDTRIGYHTVKKGDTLYSIALDNGRDYKDVAAWNNLENPNRITIGQQLRVTPPDNGAPVAVAKPVAFGGPVEVKQAAAPTSTNTEALKREPKGGKLAYSDEALAKARQGEAAARPVETRPEPKPEVKKTSASAEPDWMWPANGRLVTPFAEGGSKGLDIDGQIGDPVKAAANGMVTFAGQHKGYGNLIIIRHRREPSILSVYAHNSKLQVKEKDTVTKGQIIAEMGNSDAESPRLHFEIRREGKPADPQKFLPAR